LEIVPHDGLRKRLYLRTAGQQVDLELAGARFAKEQSIVWSPEHARIAFQVETEAAASGAIELRLTGWPAGSYRLRSEGESVTFQAEQKDPVRLKVKPGSSAAAVEIVKG